jgi:RimJ/RimL family protein N-acetyltransferase
LKLEIRAFEKDDLSNIWELTNLFRRNPISFERQLEMELEPPKEGVTRERFTAMIDSTTVGFSSLWQHNNNFYAHIALTLEARGLGVGTELFVRLKQLALEWNAPKLQCEVSNLEPRDLRFLEYHNFKIREQMVLSQLTLTDFDEAKFQVLESQALAQSTHFVRLADCPDNAETRKNLYQLVRQSVEDDPGFEGEFETPEQFNEYIWKIYWDARDNWILAVDGSRFVAMAGATPRESETWHAHLTGVARSHRGRGLAQMVKAKSTQLARDLGAKFIETSNDAKNVAMIAVNRKIGFVHVGDRYWLEIIVD